MINKNKETKRDILLSKILVTVNKAEESACIFIKFCQEHPEYNPDELHFEIQKQVIEYYYNKTIESTVIIYKDRLETDEERAARINSEYNKNIHNCLKEITKPINTAIASLIGYGDEADNKTREINHFIKEQLAKLI